jgi:hypothetical protein
MRRKLTLAFSIVLILISAARTEARDKEYAPLPNAIMTAKTVCIVNKSPYAEVADRAYSELQKWGRFKVIQSPTDADLIFVFSSETHISGYSTTSSSQTTGNVEITQTADNSATGRIDATTTGSAESTPIVRGNVFLHVVDPHTANEIWSNAESMGIHGAGHKAAAIGTLGYGALFMHPSATREIIKDLRRRMENQQP